MHILDRTKFPVSFQLISDRPTYWLFVLNLKPQADFHSLVVLKPDVIHGVPHVTEFDDDKLPDEAVKELGMVIKQAYKALRSADDRIDKILLASLNAGQNSQHLHLHLIPKYKDEVMKTVNEPGKDGGGIFFLARKEIVTDTLCDFLHSTTRKAGENLCLRVTAAVNSRIEANARQLYQCFQWRS